MKKFYLTMVAMVCGVAAMAENKIYANSIENAAAGSTVNLEVQIENEVMIKAFAFRLELPEGFKYRASNPAKLSDNRQTEESLDEGYGNVNVLNTADGNKQYAGFFTGGASLTGNSGVAMIIPITIDASVAEGVYSIKLYRGDLGITSTDNYEAVIPVGVGKATGITTATADDANAPIYNVAGQIVKKAQKGIYIQNGKKILK